MKKFDVQKTTEQKYGYYKFSLTRNKRGQVSPEENKSYPNYYLDFISDSSMTCLGEVYFSEDENKALLFFYPEHGIFGLSVAVMGALNKYLNEAQKMWKTLKELDSN